MRRAEPSEQEVERYAARGRQAFDSDELIQPGSTVDCEPLLTEGSDTRPH